MKPIMTIFFVISGSVALCQCNQYFTIKEGVKSTYGFYNAKNKLVSKSVNEFKNVNESGENLKATLLTQLVDTNKGDLISSSESDWTCEAGVIRFTMNAMSIQGTEMNTPGIDVKVEGDEMDIPSDLTPGETLNDVNYHIKMTVSGINMMDRDFFISNRKVEKEESITTPAGTFSCIKISYTTESSGKSGGMSKPLFTSVWYSRGVGMVKVEYYKDNKLSGSQILEKIEK
jgi:hypothetical protein